ncbi:MAG: UDP-3-O-(3-hydroxymyristoyl)glucosamine N-acyltransferase [Bacteroidetes bacterium]|nr:MAG: UDP-3-O-(3-hydroxymyristoyl)glucosamine N-acyltransferase [Bacteroidota bacterium]
MKLPRKHTLQEVAQMINARFVGPDDFAVTGINEIHMVEAGDITFVNVEKYYKKALTSAATIVLINKDVECPEGKALLISDDPFRDYTFLCKHFSPTPVPQTKAYHTGNNVTIGKNTIIHPGVAISDNVTIGDNCIIYPNVVIYHDTIIGNNVIIHGNATIGGDAFYYSSFKKMHSCGRTILHDGVEIGSGTTIDRGVSGDTIIGSETKIDSQVHIGHDTHVGSRCIFAAQVAIAGVSKVEDNVVLWGKVGVNKEVVIGKGAVVLASSGVSKSLEGGKVYYGSPAKENRRMLREMAAMGQLPELLDKLHKL